MMRWEIKDFYEDNKTYCIAAIGIMVAALVCAWLVYDHSRNEPIYNDTDRTVEDINRRIQGVEQRINSLQDRVTAAEKTVGGTVITIREGRENAVTIADGITSAEKRLDSIIQRQGRIENIINDIEAANRQRTAGPQTSALAK